MSVTAGPSKDGRYNTIPTSSEKRSGAEFKHLEIRELAGKPERCRIPTGAVLSAVFMLDSPSMEWLDRRLDVGYSPVMCCGFP